MDRTVIWFAIGGYAVAFCLSLLRLASARHRETPGAYLVIFFAFITHTAGLYLRGMEAGACPLGNTFEYVQFFLWSLVLLLLVAGPVFRVALLEMFTMGLTVTIGTASLLVAGWDKPHDRVLFGGNPWVELHAALSVFAYGVLGLLAVISAMYLIQYRGLTAKRIGSLFSFLPSIRQLDRLSDRFLVLSLIFLSLSFATGVLVWIEVDLRQFSAKLLMVFLLWVGIALILTGRWRGYLSGSRQAMLQVAVFLLALASFWAVGEAVSPLPNPAAPPVTHLLPPG